MLLAVVPLTQQYRCVDALSTSFLRLQAIPAGSFPPRNAPPLKLLRGAPPLAPARSFPKLPRFACAALRFASPFPLPLRSVPGWEIPLPLQFATPRLRQEAFGMYAHATAPIQEQRRVRQPKEEASMNTIVTAAAVDPSTPTPVSNRSRPRKK